MLGECAQHAHLVRTERAVSAEDERDIAGGVVSRHA
jgi:hypothetical protein